MDSSEDNTTTRKYLTADQKFKIVKEHLTTKTAISEICKKYDITPTSFYGWQEKFFKGALEGFSKSKEGPTKAEQRKIEELESQNSRMKNVIAEVISENIDLKKTNGNFRT
jgi:transposase-like protein